MTDPNTAPQGAREVRAPRGTELSCKGWTQEAALRMLMNNLDPEVAEHPDRLVVYGGTGRAGVGRRPSVLAMAIAIHQERPPRHHLDHSVAGTETVVTEPEAYADAVAAVEVDVVPRGRGHEPTRIRSLRLPRSTFTPDGW